MTLAALALENLAAQRGERVLFPPLNAKILAGEAVALVGANGAGKTTLLRIVAGFVRPMTGVVRFLGRDGPLEADEVRRRDVQLIGHQDGLKGARTAADELDFQVQWTGGTKAAGRAAAERLGLSRLLVLPVRALSAGQKRRLALARLLASPRALWLLDEPLSPLDADHRAQFGEIMGEHVARGGLILAAVHDPLPISARELRIGS